MLKGILETALWLVKLPFKLLMLPFKAVSFVVSLVFYATVLLVLAGVVWFVFI